MGLRQGPWQGDLGGPPHLSFKRAIAEALQCQEGTYTERISYVPAPVSWGFKAFPVSLKCTAENTWASLLTDPKTESC